MNPIDPLRAGDPDRVGSYRLLGRLGEGGMGQVFVGSSPGGRRVVVKLIRPEYAGNAQFRLRFAREVEAARRVGGFHTALVVDADADADPPWMVTAYVPGPSLRAAVAERGPFDPGEVRALGAGLAEGLMAIHGCGLVHRDLKPANVIMAEDGPRIIDFGIARAADADALTRHGAVIGTYAFMAPEQMRGEETGPAGDVFSLGCVLAFAATGRGPFDGPSVPAIVHRACNKPPDLGDLTGDLRDIVAACLAKDPADRPAVPDLLERLTATATPTAHDAAPEPRVLDTRERPPETTFDPTETAAEDARAERTRPRTTVIAGIGVLAAAGAAGTGLLIYFNQGDPSFEGRWRSTDPGDASAQTLTITKAGAAYNVDWHDNAATACDGAPARVSGQGRIAGGQLSVPAQLTCGTDATPRMTVTVTFRHGPGDTLIGQDEAIWHRD